MHRDSATEERDAITAFGAVRIVVASEANLALGAVSKIDLVSAGNTDIATGGALHAGSVCLPTRKA